MSATGTTLPSGQLLLIKELWYVYTVSFISLKYPLCVFSFLYDHQSPAHHYYQEKLQEYRAAASRSFSPPAAELGAKPQHPAPGIPIAVNPTPQPRLQQAENPPVKRKRKSRWGSEDDKVELPIPPIIVPQETDVPDPNISCLSGTNMCLYTVIMPKILALVSLHALINWSPHLFNQKLICELFQSLLCVSAQELRGLGYKKGKPLGLVGVTELSEDQKKQLKEQQEVEKSLLKHSSPFVCFFFNYISFLPSHSHDIIDSGQLGHVTSSLYVLLLVCGNVFHMLRRCKRCMT